MKLESTKLKSNPQPLEAGIDLEDANIEFVGNPENQTVIWLQNGKSYRFNDLPGSIFKSLLKLYSIDKNAQKLIIEHHPEACSIAKQVQLYTYYLYGDIDRFPDVLKGILQPSENHRHQRNCISLSFANKKIKVNEVTLKTRYIKMLELFAAGELDTNIATMLNIASSTYDFHKRKLFKLLNVHSKPEAVSAAYKHHILCAR